MNKEDELTIALHDLLERLAALEEHFRVLAMEDQETAQSSLKEGQGTNPTFGWKQTSSYYTGKADAYDKAARLVAETRKEGRER